MKLPLAKMSPTVIKSRDGLDLVCSSLHAKAMDKNGYKLPNEPLSMILYVAP